MPSDPTTVMFELTAVDVLLKVMVPGWVASGIVMIAEPALAELLKTRLDSFSTILALPAVLVSLKVIVLPTSEELMVELPALAELPNVSVALPCRVITELPAVVLLPNVVVELLAPVMLDEPAEAEPVNCSELLLTIVDEPAVELRLKVMKPEAAFVIFAVPAVALSLKLIVALFVICADPAMLLMLNSTSPLLTMMAVPAVLVSWKLMPPLLL